MLAEGGSEPFLAKFIEEMTGGLTIGLLFFPVRALVRHQPLGRETWRHRWPYYLAALPMFAAAATTSLWGMRLILFPVAGLGTYHYGIMPLRYLMELPMQTIIFGCVVAGVHAVDAFRAAHLRQIRAAQLEGHLAQAQLRNLRLQLQPHFLFNTLNTISSTMYQDPAAADEMIQQLADLLRASLHTAQRDEVPLTVELDVLDRYVAIMRARFGPRLEVTTTIAEDAREAAALIRDLHPDLVLLDIQMPKLDGFGVIRKVGVEVMPLTVFITAYDEHALKAFEVQALDYLLKPFAPSRFRLVLERARRPNWLPRCRAIWGGELNGSLMRCGRRHATRARSWSTRATNGRCSCPSTASIASLRIATNTGWSRALVSSRGAGPWPRSSNAWIRRSSCASTDPKSSVSTRSRSFSRGSTATIASR